MNMIDDVNKETQKRKEHKKKSSKRQRLLHKKKLDKLQLKKAKIKFVPKKNKPSVDLAKTGRLSPTKNLNTKFSEQCDNRPSKRKSTNTNETQVSLKRLRKSEKTKTNRTPKMADTKDVKKQLSPATVVTPPIEPDKNWKELSKRLGIAKKVKPAAVDTGEKAITEPSSLSTLTAGGKEKWFDDVDEILIEPPEEEVCEGNNSTSNLSAKLVTPGSNAELTKCLAMDCEMVGVGHGGKESVLARISVVNQHGHCVYDKFVKAKEEITDYRTWVSGVRPEDLENGEDLETVQKEIDNMFKGRILVGHAISNDEKVLFMNHPKRYVRDTQKYQGYRQLMGGRKPSLKILAQKVLGMKIQTGEHSSIQDAQATMRLYTLIRDKWEKKLKEKHLLNKHQRKKMIKKVSKLQASKE
ncbi:uncharacterized protein [Watersipora subatra]|uniref:uncharacterized protein n=1 Tax=Watersipora subatra TaxID=2589382 RepID=UPI00355BDAB0